MSGLKFLTQIVSGLAKPNTNIHKFLEGSRSIPKRTGYEVRNNTLYFRKKPLIQITDEDITFYLNNINFKNFRSDSKEDFLWYIIRNVSNDSSEQPVFLDLPPDMSILKLTQKRGKHSYIPLDYVILHDMEIALPNTMVLIYSYLENIPVINLHLDVIRVVKKEDGFYLQKKDFDGNKIKELKLMANFEPYLLIELFGGNKKSLQSALKSSWTTRKLLETGFYIEADPKDRHIKVIDEYKEGLGKIALHPLSIEIDKSFDIRVVGEPSFVEFVSHWVPRIEEAYRYSLQLDEVLSAYNMKRLFIAYKALPEYLKALLDKYLEIMIVFGEGYERKTLVVASIEMFFEKGTLIREGYEKLLNELSLNTMCDFI